MVDWKRKTISYFAATVAYVALVIVWRRLTDYGVISTRDSVASNLLSIYAMLTPPLLPTLVIFHALRFGVRSKCICAHCGMELRGLEEPVCPSCDMAI